MSPARPRAPTPPTKSSISWPPSASRLTWPPGRAPSVQTKLVSGDYSHRPVRPEFRRFPRSRLHADLHRQLQLYALPLQRHERPHHPAAQELHRRQLSKRDAAHSGSVRAGSAVYLPVLALGRVCSPARRSPMCATYANWRCSGALRITETNAIQKEPPSRRFFLYALDSARLRAILNLLAELIEELVELHGHGLDRCRGRGRRRCSSPLPSRR